MKHLNKILLGIIVLIILLDVIFLVYNSNNPTGNVINIPSKQPIKIGVVGILTGEAAIWGQSGVAGATLALNEINSKGGVNGRKVEFIIEDDKLSSIESVNAFNKLINIDKVDAILSISGSGPTAAAVPIAQNAKVPVIISTASAPKITKTGDYIFRDVPSDTFQGKFAADLFYNKLGKKKVAVFYIKNDWGQGISDVFIEEYKKLGGKVVYDNYFSQSQNDFKTEITKIKESDAEILYFLVYPANALSFFKQMKEMDLKIPVICGDAIDGDAVLKSEYAEGIIYTISKINTPKEFVERINSLSGYENLKPNIAGATSYDAARILFLAMEKAGTDKAKIRDEIAKTSFKGLSNPVIEFDSNGDLINGVMEAKVIKNKEAIELNL